MYSMKNQDDYAHMEYLLDMLNNQEGKNLNSFSNDDLENELHRRKEQEKHEREERLIDSQYQRWKQRTNCDFVGKAYYDDTVYDRKIAEIKFQDYYCSTRELEYHMKIPGSLSSTITNLFMNDKKLVKEVGIILNNIIKYYFMRKLNDPIVIAKLIFDNNKSTSANNLKNKKREEFNIATNQILSKFSKEQLEKAIMIANKGCKILLEKALLYKIENSIKDKNEKKSLNVPKEIKAIIATTKLNF